MNNKFYDIPNDWYKEFNSTFMDMNNFSNSMSNNNFSNSMGNNMNNNNLTNPKEGFLRGNLFNNLYDPYKNYRYRDLSAKSGREELLYNILRYNFTLIELNLYLDVNPNDRSMLELYNKYLSEKKNLVEEYEKKYGPLTIDSRDVGTNKWEWVESPWPWEVMR